MFDNGRRASAGDLGDLCSLTCRGLGKSIFPLLALSALSECCRIAMYADTDFGELTIENKGNRMFLEVSRRFIML